MQTYVPTVAYERAHAITDQTRVPTHTQMKATRSRVRRGPSTYTHTHTSIHRPHLCTDTHSGRRVFANAQCHTFTHTHIHARSVCVCVQKLVQPPWQMIVHMHAHSHMYTHARTQTHSSGLQRVGCSALSVREGCLWQAHTHTQRHTRSQTQRQTYRHTHTQGSREYSTPVYSERVQAAHGPGTVETAGTSALGGEGQPFP